MVLDYQREGLLVEMVNTGHLVGPGRRPQSRILRCLYLLKAQVTCVGAPDWCCIACDRVPQCVVDVVVVYPLPWPLLVGGVRCSRLWSTSQLLRPSGQQCSHPGGVCPQIQGRQCGAYVGAVEEMMCVVCVDVTEGA